MKKNLRIAIVGGGPGGLTLARILQTRGVASTVFERETSMDERPQGGSLDLHAETGQYALRRAGLEAEFRGIARYEDQGGRLYDRWGVLRFEDSEEVAASGDRPEVDRVALRRVLLDSLEPGVIRWGRKLRTIRPGEDGSHELVFDDGQAECFDLVVGADGAWSRVRPLVSDAVPIYSGVTCVELGIEDVDRRHPENARFVGRGTMFALGDNRGLIAHRLDNSYFCIYVAFRVPEDWAITIGLRDLPPDEARSALIELFPGWAPELLDLIRESGDRVLLRPIYALPIGHRWENRPGVTLLGDAAHLMSPWGGEGANLAMRDAADLADALGEDDWRAAVRDYEATMCDRAAIEAVGAAEGIEAAFSDDGLEHSLQHMQDRSIKPV